MKKNGGALESTIDKILERHANNKNTNEPFNISAINYKLLTEQGEWEITDQIPSDGSVARCQFDGAYKDDKYEYVHTEEMCAVKRKWFGSKVVINSYISRRIYQKHDKLSYEHLSDIQEECFKKILTDKGFFVFASGFFGHDLRVYWNKDQYDLAIKD